MKTGLKISVIRSELVKLTGGCKSAVILNQLMYATSKKESDWIKYKASEISKDTMLNCADATIRKEIKKLISGGWLEERINADYKWDRTAEYFVNTEKIKKDLIALGFNENITDRYFSHKKEFIKPFNDSWYTNYLLSKHWREFRQEAFLHHGEICSKCGSIKNLSVHHLTYENIGKEKMNDVAIVCDDCHKEIHGIKAGKR